MPKSTKTNSAKPVQRKPHAKSAPARKPGTRAKKQAPARAARAKPTRRELEQALAQRQDELAILNSVGEAMAKTLDVKTVTRIVGSKVQSIFNAELTMIRLLNPQTNMLESFYNYNLGEIELDIPLPFGSGMSSKVIKTKQPIVFDTGDQADTLGAITSAMANAQGVIQESQSGILVPIIVGDKAIGVVSVQS